MKYSEIIGVERHFKSAFDITSDKGESWKTFISNEKFEGNLSQIINCFTSPVYNNRKSIWIQGTYGTGKSHSLSVIKHLLCDDYSEIEDYLPRINRSQLRNSISTFRKEKKAFPVVMKGIYAITDVADLTYTIQQQVAAALGDIEISTKTDFQSVLQILENGSLDSFFENLLENNIELHSYAANKKQLINVLENNETKIIRIIADELKKAGLGGFRTHNIIEWLEEIKKELKQRGIADYLLLIWDEFTSLLDIPARRSILNVMQDIAEMSASEVENGADTLGVYLLLVTHKKLEATQTYKDIIDKFVLSDFKKMDEEEIEIVNSWKKAIHGNFIVDRHLRKGAVLISVDNNEVYIVKGIYSSWREILENFPMPQIVEATLMPFKDVIT